jgi:hypothetical protein
MSRGFLTFLENVFHPILPGCPVLSCYGMVVNLERWDFSKLPGGVCGGVCSGVRTDGADPLQGEFPTVNEDPGRDPRIRMKQPE